MIGRRFKCTPESNGISTDLFIDYVETWYGCYITRTTLKKNIIINSKTSRMLGESRCAEQHDFLMERYGVNDNNTTN